VEIEENPFATDVFEPLKHMRLSSSDSKVSLPEGMSVEKG